MDIHCKYLIFEGVQEFPESHTGANICAKIWDVLGNFQIRDKVWVMEKWMISKCNDFCSDKFFLQCKFYETKFDSKWSTERELAEYIVKVSQERYRRVKLPLLWLVTTTFKLMKCVDITKHEKSGEITTLLIGYSVSGYTISISAYQCCIQNTHNFICWILCWNKCLNNNTISSIYYTRIILWAILQHYGVETSFTFYSFFIV